jgi:hypothetical protein
MTSHWSWNNRVHRQSGWNLSRGYGPSAPEGGVTFQHIGAHPQGTARLVCSEINRKAAWAGGTTVARVNNAQQVTQAFANK